MAPHRVFNKNKQIPTREQSKIKLVSKVDYTKFFPQAYTNSNYGRTQNAVNIKSPLKTDYCNKNTPFPIKEE